jgi:phosphoglycolate phosphatase
LGAWGSCGAACRNDASSAGDPGRSRIRGAGPDRRVREVDRKQSMHMKFQAVLFDVDGTLLDTLEDLADSMNGVLRAEGFPVHDLEAYKYHVGEGMANLVRRTLPRDYRNDEAVVSRCLASMVEEYGRRWKEKTRPYEGIPELLDALVRLGIKMAILSNKPDSFTRLAVSQLLPAWRFEEVRGERPPTPRKPDPTAALEIAGNLEIHPGQILYLGDTGTDMETAGRAGMYAVGALWGFRQAQELTVAGARTLIGRPLDLMQFFEV